MSEEKILRLTACCLSGFFVALEIIADAQIYDPYGDLCLLLAIVICIALFVVGVRVGWMAKSARFSTLLAVIIIITPFYLLLASAFPISNRLLGGISLLAPSALIISLSLILPLKCCEPN